MIGQVAEFIGRYRLVGALISGITALLDRYHVYTLTYTCARVRVHVDEKGLERVKTFWTCRCLVKRRLNNYYNNNIMVAAGRLLCSFYREVIDTFDAPSGNVTYHYETRCTVTGVVGRPSISIKLRKTNIIANVLNNNREFSVDSARRFRLK